MMENTKVSPVSIYYRRGFLVYGAWLALAVPAILTVAFIVFTARSVGEEPGVTLSLWALMLVFLLALAVVIVPLIERFSRNEPAIIVSSEGIKTRDMEQLLPRDGIEKLTTGAVISQAGRYTTTVNTLEIHPKVAAPKSFSWRKLVDAHANPFRVVWHVLSGPERLGDALHAHAPTAVLAKSDLARLPEPRLQNNHKH